MTRPIEDLPSFIHQFLFGTIDVLIETAERVKTRMSEEGKPITYPVQWDSERQRRYVMAKLRKENNVPYRRTGLYAAGWKTERTAYGAKLSNRHPAGAIGGTPSGWQSRIHRGRWPYLLNVLFEELAKIPAEISNKFKVIGNP
jgi:hypothetical protein